MTKALTRGATLALDVENTGIGTGDFSSAKHIRYDAETLPSSDYASEAQANLGHENIFQRDDDPMPFRQREEGGVTVKFRTGVDASTAPPVVTFLESACCQANTVTATTTAGSPAVGAIELTADNGAVGKAQLIEIDTDGLFWPTLTAAYAASTITPSMDLSTAPSASDIVGHMTTITPGYGSVSNKTVAFQQRTRATHTTSEDWAMTHLACALKSVGPITVRRGTTPTFAGSFYCCKRDPSAASLGAATFLDAERYLRFDDRLELGFATASAAGGITRATINWEEATFDPGIDTQPDEASGTTTYANTIGFFPNTANNGSLKIKGEFLKAYWDNAALASQTRRYIHIVQPTDDITDGVPAMGIWMPNCFISAPPVMLREANTYYKVELTYGFDAAGYGSDTSNDSLGMAPWYWGISTNASA